MIWLKILYILKPKLQIYKINKVNVPKKKYIKGILSLFGHKFYQSLDIWAYSILFSF